jgi:hypothetical protein
MHGLYAPQHKRGEWFTLSLFDQYSFQDRCKMFETFYMERDSEIDF